MAFFKKLVFRKIFSPSVEIKNIEKNGRAENLSFRHDVKNHTEHSFPEEKTPFSEKWARKKTPCVATG
jgi:hypothetical protein